MGDNQRTTILIEDEETGGLRLKLSRAPGGRRGKGKVLSRPLVLTQPTNPDNARNHGARLVEALNEEDAARDAVAHALRAPLDEVWPLCFELETDVDEVDGFLWEALWVKQHNFLALCPQWPIARVVGSDHTMARMYHAPLRILAVMSAVGVSAREEWEGLRSAVSAASGILPVHLTVVVGELDLLTELQQLEADASENSTKWLKVIALEDQQTINWALKQQRPHIVHFFCHGSASVGIEHISFATIRDRADDNEARESVTIDIRRLQLLIDNRRLWLVTLNCCSGAESAGRTQTLAESIVEAGAGAALGWRTPVDPESAHILTSTVYHSLLSDIADRMDRAEVEGIVQLELATLGYSLRDALAAPSMGALNWTLPVLFVARDPLSITIIEKEPDDPADLGKVDVSANDQRLISDATAANTLREFNKALSGLTSVTELADRLVAEALSQRESDDGQPPASISEEAEE